MRYTYTLGVYEEYEDYIQQAIDQLKKPDILPFTGTGIETESKRWSIKKDIREILERAKGLYLKENATDSYFKKKFEDDNIPVVEEAVGDRRYDPCEDETLCSLNYSDILSYLIKEAGRVCERFSSDLFVQWSNIEKNLREKDIMETFYLFGFRKHGVDHEDYVLKKLQSPEVYGYNVYESLYAMKIETNAENEIKMILKQVG